VNQRAVRTAETCIQTHPDGTMKSFAERLKAPIKRFYQQLGVIRRALRHPQVPWYAKMVVGCAFLYVISPIQLIPNFIPIIGQMDDVLAITLSVKFLRRCVSPGVLEECQGKRAPTTPTIPMMKSAANLHPPTNR
jgi:uncharacterized membrane protein YkvA (DUF1232 family)